MCRNRLDIEIEAPSLPQLSTSRRVRLGTQAGVGLRDGKVSVFCWKILLDILPLFLIECMFCATLRDRARTAWFCCVSVGFNFLSEIDSQATPVIELSQLHAAGASRSLTVTVDILTGDTSAAEMMEPSPHACTRLENYVLKARGANA
jgi:hypothetical protein